MGLLTRIFGDSGNTLDLLLPKRHYQPGDLLTGTLYFRVDTPIDISCLLLEATGREETRVRRTQTRQIYTGRYGSTTITETVTYRENWEHLRVGWELAGNLGREQRISPGLYVYPFEFYLPRVLPSSCEISATSSASASIKYELKATVKVPGLLSPNLRQRIPISIKSSGDRNGTNNEKKSSSSFTMKLVSGSLEHPVKFWCCNCARSGHLSLFATINTDRCYYDDQLILSLQLDCSALRTAVRGLKVKVIEETSISASIYTDRGERILYETSLPLPTSTTKDHISLDSSFNFNCVIPIPSANLDHSPENRGKYLSVRHHIIIETILPWWSRNGRLAIPVEIFHRPVEEVISTVAGPSDLMVVNMPPVILQPAISQ